MAVDKNKIIAEATRLVQKGQFDKAIKAYERILADDPKEVRILLKVGELHQKKGDGAAAAGSFNQVAEIYGEQGFFLKAVAVYKQIAKLAPDDVRVNERLASLYQQLGLMNDAMGSCRPWRRCTTAAGTRRSCSRSFAGWWTSTPTTSRVASSSASFTPGQERTPKPSSSSAAPPSHLRENKRVEEYLKVAERIALIAPDDLKLTRELAHAYLSRGDTKRALAKLQLCFKADPKDVETLRLLAQAFRDLGQTSKTVSVYKELARVYAERGRKDEARITWKMVHELAPDDAEAGEALGFGSAAAPPAPAEPPPGPRAPAAGSPPGARPAAPGASVAAPPRPATPAPPAPGPRPAGTADSVSRLITETDVYVKYGLHQKALDHVHKVLAADAENPDALERVRDIREALGDRAGAADAAERAARSLLERGPEDRARAAVLRLRELDPGRDTLVELAGAAGIAEELRGAGEDDLALSHAADAGEERVAEEVPPSVASGAGAEAVSEEGAAEESVVEADAVEVVPEASVLGDEPLGPPLDDEPLGPPVIDDGVVEASELLSGPDPVAEDAVPEKIALAPTPAEAPEPLAAREEVAGGHGDVEGPEPILLEPEPLVLDPEPIGLEPEPIVLEPEPVVVEPEPILLEPEPVVLRVEPMVVEPEAPGATEGPLQPPPAELTVIEVEPEPPVPAAVALPRAPEVPDLAEELEEVAFYEGQGLVDEALEAVRGLVFDHPSHPLLLARLQDLEAQVAARASAAAASPPSAGLFPPPEGSRAPPVEEGFDGFDIGRELAAELGGPEEVAPAADDFQYSVEDVFDQFKRGVEKAVRPEDSDTHYDLGIAYKEMGLLDDALSEFRTALSGRNRRREVDVLTMVGLCHGLKGDHREAVQAFRRALRSEYLSGEAAKAIHYELGVAHEALSEPGVALWYFQKIAKVDPRYRDARAHVDRLGGGPGQPPGEDASPASPEPPPPPASPAGGATTTPRGPKKNIGYV